MSDPVDILLSRLEGVRQTKPDSWEAICPAHADRNPSLAIARGDDGRVLLKCWAGCGAADVVQAVGLTLADLFVRDEHQHRTPTRNRAYPNYRKILQLVRHEVLALMLFASDLREGKAPSDEDFAIMYRAFENLDKAMRASDV